MIRLIHGDCLEEIPKLIDEGIEVDLILTDVPYGTINGLNLDGWNNDSYSWDDCLPTKRMYEYCEKMLRMNGVCILFSQEPYTSHLRTSTISNLPFVYEYYWIKDHFANPFNCNVAPVNYVENLNVFRKRFDSNNHNPIREYSKKIIEYCGSRKTIIEKIGGRADHFLRYNSSQFALCTKETYSDLIKICGIDKMDGFMTYDELYEINLKFNLKFNLNQKYKSNVLSYKKSYNHYHPTEKPVDLLIDLIETYTDENDTVLDFTMGSGSTGVACRNTNRNFIGIELNEEYYNIACDRINNYQGRLV